MVSVSEETDHTYGSDKCKPAPRCT